MVGADTEVHALLFPYTDPYRSEALLCKHVHRIHARWLNELRTCRIQVTKVPTDDPRVLGEIFNHGAHGIKPRLDALGFVILAYAVGRRGHTHLRSVAVHELCEICAAGAVTAHEPVDAQLPDVAGLCDRAFGLDLFVFFIHIEIILHRFLGVKGVHEFIDFRCFKTCEGNIEFTAVQLRE